MKYTIALQVANSISDHGCSLDELVARIKDVFTEEGLPGFVVLLLKLIDEDIRVGIARGQEQAVNHLLPCCDQPELESKGLRRRTIRSSLGVLDFRCRQQRCKNCRKTQMPLYRFLKLAPHQTKTVELEEIVSNIIVDQSYRRTSHHLMVAGSIGVPKSTVHDWIKSTPCDQIVADQRELAQIMADGTGFKRRPNKKNGMSNRGELKVVLGIDDEGDTHPMGVWSDKSWAEIGAAILNPEEAASRPRALADDLVIDGEPGMAEGLQHLADGVQRCHWHLPRDLGHAMWQEGAPLQERKTRARKLARLIAIELPKDSVKEIKQEDKDKLLEQCEKVENELNGFIDDLDAKGYRVAANYVSNAKRNLFTYLGTWFELGIHCPRTTSLIERLMREIGRRLKRIAFGWSEQGAAKMAQMVITRILDPKGWREHWARRKQELGNAIIVFQGAHVVA